MKTMIIYYDRQRQDAYRVSPTEAFYRNEKGEWKDPSHGKWQELASALVPNYYSFELID